MTAIYHMTHHSNLGAIIANGGLLSDRATQNIPHTRVGHLHIKDRRLNRKVPIPPGGTVGDYVPFYFAPKPPMLYAISRGSVEGYAGGQKEVVYLVSSAESVDQAGLDWVFTDGHADMILSDFYNSLADLNKVDWQVLNGKWWFDTKEDGDRCRRRQAEFLVRNAFPWRFVTSIGVYDAKTQHFVVQTVASNTHKPPVNIERSWYY